MATSNIPEPYEMAEITLSHHELIVVLRHLGAIRVVDVKMDDILPLKNVLDQMKFAHQAISEINNDQ